MQIANDIPIAAEAMMPASFSGIRPPNKPLMRKPIRGINGTKMRTWLSKPLTPMGKFYEFSLYYNS